MNLRLKILLALLMLLLQCTSLSLASAQAVLRVPSQYPTIQSALNAAPANATVLVSPGIYNESPSVSNRSNLTIQGINGRPVLKGGFILSSCRNILVQGFECDSASYAGVYADGGGNISAIDIHALGGQICVWLRNFTAGTSSTVTDCTADNSQWGIYLEAGTHPTVRRCTVTNARNWGIFVGNGFGQGLIDNCTVSNSGLSNIFVLGNKDNRTDAVEISSCTVTGSFGFHGIEINGIHSSFVHDCTAFSNYAYGFVNWYCDTAIDKNCASHDNVDGFDFSTCRTGTADHCLAYHNAQNGIAVLTAEASYGAASVQVQNCTLTNNPSGIYCQPGWTLFIQNTISALNNRGIILENGSIILEDYNDFNSNANGNINWSPQGVHDLSEYPELTTDFHLSQNSPCIDSGTPTRLDPDGSVSDIGCFYLSHASPTVSGLKLEMPQYVVNAGTKTYQITLHMKGSGHGHITGHWVLDGKRYFTEILTDWDLTAGGWTAGPTIAIPKAQLEGNHTLYFTVDAPSGLQSGNIAIAITKFDSAINGFKFVNAFPRIPGKIDQILGDNDGFCVGMSWKARNYYIHKQQIPQDTLLPSRTQDSGLYWDTRLAQIRGIKRFQLIDSLRIIGYFGNGNQALQGETDAVRQALQDNLVAPNALGSPTVIALTVNADGTGGGHAVLATGTVFCSDAYIEGSADQAYNVRRFFVCDPNVVGIVQTVDVYNQDQAFGMAYDVPGAAPKVTAHYLFTITL